MYEIAFDRQGTDSPMNEEQNNQNPVNFNDSEPRQSAIQPNEFTFTFLTNDSPQPTESTSPSGEQAPHIPLAGGHFAGLLLSQGLGLRLAHGEAHEVLDLLALQ